MSDHRLMAAARSRIATATTRMIAIPANHGLARGSIAADPSALASHDRQSSHVCRAIGVRSAPQATAAKFGLLPPHSRGRNGRIGTTISGGN